MKAKNKMFWVILITLLAIVICIITINYNQINYFIKQNVEVYGYPAIFLFCFFTDSIDQLILPEIPASLGVLYGLNVLYVFLIAALGISLMGFINFNIGRRVFSKKIMDWCTTEKYANYCKFFYKYGKLSLLLAALTPLPYVTFVWLSGAFGIKFKTFFIFGTLAKALRLGTVLLVVSVFSL